MKAILLAAGLGTRLRPLTDRTPKCLLPVGGVPLLDIWLDKLADAGIDEVLVNTHHLAHLVRSHVCERTVPPVIHLAYEAQLLGSAGTLRANRNFVANDDMFLAINADNLTDFDLSVLIDAHRSNRSLATLSLFHTPHPEACGIVEVDADGLVIGYTEKPANPVSNLANAGIYAFDRAVIDHIVDPAPTDIGFELLPRLVGLAKTVTLSDAYFIDIGSPAALSRANEEWKGGMAR